MKTPPVSSLTADSADTVRRGLVIMLLSVLGFTVNSLLLKHLSRTDGGVGIYLPLLFRAAIGMFIVLVFFRGKRPTQVRPIFRDRLLILRGVTGLIGTAAYYATVSSLGAGKATLICNTYVIFASIIAVLALGEKLSRTRMVWLSISFVGIVLLVGSKGAGGNAGIGIHEVIALAGAVTAAWSVVLVRQLVRDYSVGTIYLAQCLWILLPMLFLAAPDLSRLSPNEWALLALAGTAASYGQLAMNEGYRCLSVSVGASVQMIWPVATSFGGWLLFVERFGTLQLLGALLVLVSIWRISVARSRPGSVKPV